MDEIEITEATARGIVETVKSLKVVDARTYELMANGLQLLRKAKQFFEDRLRPRIAEAHEHHANLLKDLRADTDPIDAMLKYGNGQISAYDTEQERQRQVKQQQAEAEQKKQEAEKKKQLLDLAKKVGDKELIAEVKAAPSEAPPIVVPKDVPKVEGLSYREDFKFEVVDPLKIPREYLMVDESKIGKIVRALKQTTSIPGIRVFVVKVPIHRA